MPQPHSAQPLRDVNTNNAREVCRAFDRGAIIRECDDGNAVGLTQFRPFEAPCPLPSFCRSFISQRSLTCDHLYLSNVRQWGGGDKRTFFTVYSPRTPIVTSGQSYLRW